MTWSFFWRVLSWYILQYCFYDYEFHGRMYNKSINCLFEIFPSIKVLWTQCWSGFGHVCTVAFTYRTLYARNSLIHLSLHGRSDVTVIVETLLNIHYIPDCLSGLLLLLDNNFSKTAIYETALPSRANPSILKAKQHDSHGNLMITKGIILECTSWAEMLFAWSYLSKLFRSFNKSDPFTQMSLSVGIDREWSEPKNRGITYKTFGLKG